MLNFCRSSAGKQCDGSSADNHYSLPIRERRGLEENGVKLTAIVEDSHNREPSTPSPPPYNQIITLPPNHKEARNFKLDLTELAQEVKDEI